MIERQAEQDGQTSWAYYSLCEAYRYGLRRVWNADLPDLLYIMLNPSTATELQNDPTIESCQRRARRLGFGGMRITNLFAWRATRPEDLRRAEAPEGPENDAFIASWAAKAGVTVAGWGVHGGFRDRGRQVAQTLPGDVRHLGLTKAGHPRHPLYVSYETALTDWPRNMRYAYA